MAGKSLFQSAKELLNKNGTEEDRSADKKSADCKDHLEAAKETSRGVFQSASEKLGAFRRGFRKRADKAAEKVAQACTEWTGRETSASQVKKVTVTTATIGGVVASAMAVGPMAGMAMRQARMAKLRSMQEAQGQTAEHGADPGHSETDPQSGDSMDAGVMPSADPIDPSGDWEQDAVDYDQAQHDQFQDHLGHQDQLDNAIDDQVSYNESFDMGFDSFDY